MVAEMPSNSVSIPVGRMSVKKALAGLLDGLPVVSAEYDVSVQDGMTAAEFSVALDRLQKCERGVMVRIRFREGALWNALHESRFRSVRREFMASLSSRKPEEARRLLKRLRQCGWVAHKWLAVDRDDKHCWTWYVENPKEDGAGEESLPYYVAVRRISADDGEWYECAGAGDKRIMVRVPSAFPEDAAP